jgi:hypothetical protein
MAARPVARTCDGQWLATVKSLAREKEARGTDGGLGGQTRGGPGQKAGGFAGVPVLAAKITAPGVPD